MFIIHYANRYPLPPEATNNSEALIVTTNNNGPHLAVLRLNGRYGNRISASTTHRLAMQPYIVVLDGVNQSLAFCRCCQRRTELALSPQIPYQKQSRAAGQSSTQRVYQENVIRAPRILALV